ncbi:NrfD/PsrC family molybdoenzyme membrane anchor subunit, partial [Thermodesulfobacteriota bacterium]
MGEPRLIEYEWMVKFTPQREWIDRRGLLLWLAFFFTEIGAGIYFVALFLNSPHARLLGWLVTLILGGFIHTAFLGKPLRSWRIFLRLKSSELSRGLWAILLFAVIGFFQVLPVVFSNLPWTGEHPALKIVMGILCILLLTHGYITMGVVRALPLWNTTALIPLVLASGIWIGSQTVELMLFFGGGDPLIAEIWSRWSLIGYMATLTIFIWGAYYSSESARVSVKRLLRGDASVRFYIGVIIIGIIIPLIITLFFWKSAVGRMSGGFLITRFVCVIIGDLVMRYSIMRCADPGQLVCPQPLASAFLFIMIP